ncbi:MAG: cellulase family glycosylhydrolase [Acidobacteriaceae bacterium]|nr:cellulase family glycosylhydrolase [Acidobacteriaceae bacterium]
MPRLPPEQSDFVQTNGISFHFRGTPLPLSGANNYYLGFAPDSMVQPVFKLASDARMNVLRAWACLDCGAAVGGAVPPGTQWGAYFHYWDAAAQKPAFNDGPDGFERLDRTIALAEQYDIRLILPLVNYWNDFGGMKQYLDWFALSNQIEFYTRSETRQAFRHYIQHVITRVNTCTGRQYRDEPSILAWELANEPRCMREDGKPLPEILLAWIHEMSAWMKTLDANHLIGTGDEGHFGLYGVDCERILKIDTIDFGTCHYYPHFAGEQDPVEFGRCWIRERIRAGERAGKPMLLEEFGWKVDAANQELGKRRREAAFAAWRDEVTQSGGAGALVWMLAASLPDGSPYPDYDGYTVYTCE